MYIITEYQWQQIKNYLSDVSASKSLVREVETQSSKLYDNAIDHISKLKKTISMNDKEHIMSNMHDCGWNGAINTIINVLK